MMNMETRIAILRKEVEIYNNFINLIPTIYKVIHAFNGKVINKKFNEALDNAVNGKEKREYYAITEYGYDRNFIIKVHCYNDSIKEVGSNSEYPNWYKVSNSNYYFCFPKDNFIITDSGNYRVIADKMRETIIKEVPKIQSEIETIENGINQADEMISEAKRIKAELEAFNNKYDYNIRNVMGVVFDLRDNSNFQYRNYNI